MKFNVFFEMYCCSAEVLCVLQVHLDVLDPHWWQALCCKWLESKGLVNNIDKALSAVSYSLNLSRNEITDMRRSKVEDEGEEERLRRG